MNISERHCGLVVNYKCNAACRHCLYACSPSRSGGYMNASSCERICNLLKSKDIHSLHIGGGEPFLDFDKLLEIVHTVHRCEINIEYLETNGFWASDEKQAIHYVNELKKAGINKLLISIDPFHIEYVPVGLPLRLAEICKNEGMGYFYWQEQYKHKLSLLDRDKIYTRTELEHSLSQHYIVETTNSYGLGIETGRAINIGLEYMPKKPVSDLLTNSLPCKHLLSTSFIHIDHNEKYVVPSCTGITIPLEDAMKGIPRGRYLVYETLVIDGIRGLIKFSEGLGVMIDDVYVSYCSLCFDIRHKLSMTKSYAELDYEHYESVMSFY